MARAKAVRFKQHDANVWAVRWTTLAGERKFRKCPDRRTADDLADEINRALALGREWAPQQARGRSRLEDLTESFLRDRARTLGAKTLKRYGHALDLFERYVGDTPDLLYLDQLTRTVLAGFWDWLADPKTARHENARSVATCRKHVEVAELLWEWASDSDDYSDETPKPRRLEMPKRPRHLPRAPTWPECDAMIAELGPEWQIRAAHILRMTGARREEVLLLDWRDVDLPKRLLTFQPENTKAEESGRTIPIAESLALEMSGWGKREGSVVRAPALELSGRGHIDRDFRRAWKRAGVREEAYRKQPCHALRKAMETELVALGVDQRLIDHITGHKPHGTGATHYRDPRAFADALAEAIALVLPIGSPVEARSGSGLVSVRGDRK